MPAHQFEVVDGPLRGQHVDLVMGPGAADLVIDLRGPNGQPVRYTARLAPYRSDKWLDPFGVGSFGGPFGLWLAVGDARRD